jgi:hypothetical protein
MGAAHSLSGSSSDWSILWISKQAQAFGSSALFLSLASLSSLSSLLLLLLRIISSLRLVIAAGHFFYFRVALHSERVQ